MKTEWRIARPWESRPGHAVCPYCGEVGSVRLDADGEIKTAHYREGVLQRICKRTPEIPDIAEHNIEDWFPGLRHDREPESGVIGIPRHEFEPYRDGMGSRVCAWCSGERDDPVHVQPEAKPLE